MKFYVSIKAADSDEPSICFIICEVGQVFTSDDIATVLQGDNLRIPECRPLSIKAKC